MVDRFGQPILIGWPAHHILWVQAAMMLDIPERQAAFRDIAQMTGRSYKSVDDLRRRLEQKESMHRKRELLAIRSLKWFAEAGR